MPKNTQTKTNIEDIKKQAIDEYKQTQSLEFARVMQRLATENSNPKRKQTQLSRKFTKEQVETYLDNPQQYEKELRLVSRTLYNKSSQYSRLINHFANSALICPVVIPLSIDKNKANMDKVRKDYQRTIIYLNFMNIQHEFVKIIKTVFKEDIYYGYEFETKDSYYIKTMNPDYCRIASIVDGVFNYSFDFSYFDGDTDGYLLENCFPQEFKQKYELYKTDRANLRWQELDHTKTICIKQQEEIEFPLPMFASVFNDLYDIQDYKDLNKSKTEIDNYKFIGLEIPRKKDADGDDQFELSGETIMTYYNLISSVLPRGIGALLSPMPIKEISFPKQNTDIDNVANATRNYWDATGTAEVLFGSGAVNAGTLKYSIKTDEVFLFKLYRQLERWLNKKFKMALNGKFEVKLLDVTEFSKQETIDNLIKAAQYGVPVKTYLSSAMNVTPSEMVSLTILENDILGLHKNWIPLNSSHTQSGTGEDGRPTESEEDLGESGQQTRDNSSNENRD